MRGLRDVFLLCAKICAILGLRAKVRILTLRCANSYNARNIYMYYAGSWYISVVLHRPDNQV